MWKSLPKWITTRRWPFPQFEQASSIQDERLGICVISVELIVSFGSIFTTILPHPILKAFTPASCIWKMRNKLSFSKSSSYRIMRIQHLRFVCVAFMIMLMISQISSYHRNDGMKFEGAKQTEKTGFYSRNSWYVSREAPEEGSRVTDRVTGVSLREVPQGPNPLHNWSPFLQLYLCILSHTVLFLQLLV